jgi:serine/threonine-protein kinase HipA
VSANRLVVVLYGQVAGVIERAGGSLTFTYDDDYRAVPTATPLSLSMPLSGARYTNRYVEAHLRGLLPDNDDVRRRWAQHFGLRDRDTFGLIAAIGGDAAGGALFIPDEQYPTALSVGSVTPVSEAEIADRLRRLREDDTDWLGDGEHWSLAGAQSKFTLRALGDGWGVAHGAEPSTHIVKPGIGTIPSQALIEHVSMRATAALGLRVASTLYIEFEDQPAIVVTRFDRRQRDGRWERIHQEDLCQALGLDPSRKYETDRGPGIARIGRLLRDTSGPAAVDQFGRAVIANYLLGAPDAHAKNYSVMLAGAAVQLADLYDVASGLTAARGGRLRFPRAAMSLGGERSFGDVRGRHWTGFATALGVAPDQVHEWVLTLARQAPAAIADTIRALPPRQRRRPELRQLTARVRLLSELTRRHLDDTAPGRRSTGPTGPELLADVDR